MTKKKKLKNDVGKRTASPVDDRPLEHVLTTIEQIRSIAVPVRLQILRAMTETARTTKQVATELGESPTGLYRHVEALAQAGLIELVAEVPKRGTIQKFYRAVARSFRADESCFAGTDYPDARNQVLVSLLEGTRAGITTGRQTTSVAEGFPAIAGSCLLEVADAEQAKQLLQVVLDSVAKWAESKRGKSKLASKRAGRHSTRLSVFIHPEPNSRTSNKRGVRAKKIS